MANKEKWDLIHKLAFYCNDESTSRAYIILVTEMIAELPNSACRCRDHGQQYLKEHPMESMIGWTDRAGHPIGMFVWSWRFHNSVNIRLGREPLDWDSALKEHQPETCDEICTAPKR